MKKIDKESIQLISRHSNISQQGIDRALKENIYNDQKSWQKFIQLFLMTLGIGFTVSGIIFFFAYNWANLDKFVKIGLTQGLLIVLVACVLFSKLSLNLKNIILCGASLLVGALFAVFGQIYQTGANAYDFFLAWTIFITLWTIISNFTPLWLIFLILLNTTFVLYTQQVATDWSWEVINITLLLINTSALILSLLIAKNKPEIKVEKWFIYTLAIAVVSISTFGICSAIFDNYYQDSNTIFITLSVILYALGIWFGIKERSIFYIALIPTSLIIIVASFLFSTSTDEGMFLLVGAFIIGSITVMVKTILILQKKWNHES